MSILHKNKEYIVDQLLIKNYIGKGNISKPEKTPITKIIADFMCYADPPAQNCLMECDDLVWKDGIVREVASKGFNHLANCCNFRSKTTWRGQSINIVEGFLVLETTN